MKKNNLFKLLTLFVAVTMLLSSVRPLSIVANAQLESADGYLNTNKSITTELDSDGNYTMSLEAWADSSKPLDIIFAVNTSEEVNGAFNTVSSEASFAGRTNADAYNAQDYLYYIDNEDAGLSIQRDGNIYLYYADGNFILQSEGDNTTTPMQLGIRANELSDYSFDALTFIAIENLAKTLAKTSPESRVAIVAFGAKDSAEENGRYAYILTTPTATPLPVKRNYDTGYDNYYAALADSLLPVINEGNFNNSIMAGKLSYIDMLNDSTISRGENIMTDGLQAIKDILVQSGHINQDGSLRNNNREAVIVTASAGIPGAPAGENAFYAEEPSTYVDASNEYISNMKAYKDVGIDCYSLTCPPQFKFDGAAPTSIGYILAMNGSNDLVLNTAENALYRVMQYASSNFPSANAIDYGGFDDNDAPAGSAESKYNGYMKYVENNSQLLIYGFDLAEKLVVKAANYGEQCVLHDNLTAQFKLAELPEGSAKETVSIYKAAYTGYNTWAEEVLIGETSESVVNLANSGIDVSLNRENGTVDVTGFDYTANMTCEADESNPASGQKLIVKVRVKPNCFGGSRIPVSLTSLGIYPSADDVADIDERIVPFEALELTIIPNTSFANKRKTYTYRGVDSNLRNVVGCISGFAPDGDNNANVRIEYEITAIRSGETNKKATLTVTPGQTLAEGLWTPAEFNGLNAQAVNIPDNNNRTYRVKCTLTNSTAPFHTTSETSEGTIALLNPKAFFKDTIVEIGTSTNIEDENFVDLRWQTVEEYVEENSDYYSASDVDTMLYVGITASAPVLDCVYYIEDNEEVINPEITIRGTTNIHGKFLAGAVDVSDYVIVSKECELDTENSSDYPMECITSNGTYPYCFTIHADRFKLKITKTIDSGENPTQDFVYTVIPLDEEMNEVFEKSFDVVLHAKDFTNGSCTGAEIIQLYDGVTYVIEEADWAWRYEQQESQTVCVHNSDEATVEFTGDVDNSKWFSSESIEEYNMMGGFAG